MDVYFGFFGVILNKPKRRVDEEFPKMSVVRCITRLEPCYIQGVVLHGFRRGTTLLDCPTANLPTENIQNRIQHFKMGVYFGWASLRGEVYKMVANIGKNPSFGNAFMTVEVHLLHTFNHDFYDEELRVVILGSIRTENKFNSLEELKTAIHEDCRIAESLLEEEAYSGFKHDAFLL